MTSRPCQPGDRRDPDPWRRTCRHGRLAGLIVLGCSVLAGSPAFGQEAASGSEAGSQQTAAPERSPFLPQDLPLGPGRLSIGLGLRARYESFGGYNVKGYALADRDQVLLLRTRVDLDYRLDPPAASSTFRLFVQMQDARDWLSDLGHDDFAGSNPFYDVTELRQGFVTWQGIGATSLKLQLGRQNISYADNRVFGPGEWGNVGRYWWDAARLTVPVGATQLELLYGQRVVSEPESFNDQHHGFEMAAAYAHIGGLPLRLDAFYVLRLDDHELRGEHGIGEETRHSTGVSFEGDRGAWDFRGTLVAQLGSSGGDDIRTLGGNLRAGYTFPTRWRPWLAAEVSYASGDADPDDGHRGTFDGVFGAIDKVYGRMNFFSWKNLEDYQLSASARPYGRLQLLLELHLFRLAAAGDAWYWASGNQMRRDPTGGSGRTVGTELDLVVTWTLSENLGLFAGYCHFVPGEFVRNTGDDPRADWTFLQLTWTP